MVERKKKKKQGREKKEINVVMIKTKILLKFFFLGLDMAMFGLQFDLFNLRLPIKFSLVIC